MSHRYFASQIQGDTALLLGEEAAHVARVLRCKPGEALLLFDGSGSEYDAEIVEVTPQQVRLAIRARRAATTEPGVAVTLYVGLPKGDKLELIVQKATELGAVRVVPFESRFCVAKMKNEAAKLERWARIAKEAAKQSGHVQGGGRSRCGAVLLRAGGRRPCPRQRAAHKAGRRQNGGHHHRRRGWL